MGGTPLAASAEGAWHPWVQQDPIAGFDVPWKRLVPITAVGKRPRLCESEPLSPSFKREVRRCHGPARARHTRETQRECVSEPAAEAPPPPRIGSAPCTASAGGALGQGERGPARHRGTKPGKQTFIPFPGDADRGRRGAGGSQPPRSCRGQRSRAPAGCGPLPPSRPADPSERLPRRQPLLHFSAHPASRPCGRRGAGRRRDRMTAAGSQLQRPRGFVGETSTRNDVEDVRGPRSRRGAASRTIETIRRELTNSANGALAGKEVDVAKELK